MMTVFKKIRSICLILVCTSYSACALDVSKAIPKLEPIIEKTIKDWDIPGLAVGIVEKGQVVFLKTYGVQKKGGSLPITPETLLPIHSLTKNFTATLVMILHQDGLLDINAPLQTYIPEFQLQDAQKSKELTVFDVVSQRSGLPGFCFDSLWALGFSEDDMIKKFTSIPFKVAFQQEYSYQNVLFGLLRRVIEKVTNKSYEEVLDEKILKPLNLKGTKPGLDFWKTRLQEASWWRRGLKKIGLLKSRAVLPHDSIWNPSTLRFDCHVMETPPYVYTQIATSGINSTLNDMVEWVKFHLSPYKLLNQDSLKLMRTTHSRFPLKNDAKQFPQDRFFDVGYGVGWFVSNYGVPENSLKLLSHMGGLTGGRTLISIAPDQEVGIVLLCNMGGMRVNLALEEIRNTFYDLVLGLPEVNWNERIQQEILANKRQFYKRRQEQRLNSPQKPLNLSFYEGTYTNNLYGNVVIKAEKDGLKAIHEKGRTWDLGHWNASIFSYKGSDISPNLGSNDEGELWFYGNPPNAQALQFTLLYEGEQPVFVKNTLSK